MNAAALASYGNDDVNDNEVADNNIAENSEHDDNIEEDESIGDNDDVSIEEAQSTEKRGIRYCSSDNCEGFPVKNRDTNACMNFKLIHNALMRGHARPRHLMPWLHTGSVAPMNYETDILTLRSDRWPSPRSPSHVPSNPPVSYENDPAVFHYRFNPPRTFVSDPQRTDDPDYRSVVASELDVDAATLIPVNKYIRKNVTNQRGKKRRKLVRDTNTWANHFRRRNSFRDVLRQEMEQYQAEIDRERRQHGPESGNNYRDFLQQVVIPHLDISQSTDRIVATFESSRTIEGTIVRQEVIVVERFRKRVVN
jgi:hypothetical protein